LPFFRPAHCHLTKPSKQRPIIIICAANQQLYKVLSAQVSVGRRTLLDIQNRLRHELMSRCEAAFEF